METLLIKIKDRQKTNALIQFLQSIEYVESVAHLEKFVGLGDLLADLHQTAQNTALSEMTLEEINDEIKAYRDGK